MAKPGLLTVVALLIAGCASQSVATQSSESDRILLCTEGWSCVSGPEDTPLPSSTDNGRIQTDPSSQLTTPSASAAQQIFIGNIQGNVSIKQSPNGDYVPAQSGMILPLGVLIQTDNSSRARLTILPEGTTINIGNNSHLVLKSLSSNSYGKSEIHIALEAGKIWVLPRNGQITIKTEIGTALTGDSPLGVIYDPGSGHLQASCLEGICSLKSDEGEVILTSGMMATINDGRLPYSAEQMNADLLQEWVNENPNLKDYFGSQLPGWLPSPNSSGD